MPTFKNIQSCEPYCNVLLITTNIDKLYVLSVAYIHNIWEHHPLFPLKGLAQLATVAQLHSMCFCLSWTSLGSLQGIKIFLLFLPQSPIQPGMRNINNLTAKPRTNTRRALFMFMMLIVINVPIIVSFSIPTKARRGRGIFQSFVTSSVLLMWMLSTNITL